MEDLSIVIVNYKTWDNLSICLESILKQFADLKFPFDASYINHDDQSKNFYLQKAGADLFWIQNSTSLDDIDLTRLASWTLNDISRTCSFRGGQIVELSNENVRKSIEIICKKLSCGHLAQQTYARGGELFFLSGALVPSAIAKQWRKLYYDPNDYTKQTQWNERGWFLTIFHEFYSYYFAYLTNEETFPPVSDIRTFCQFSAPHHQASSADILLKYSDKYSS